MSQSLYPRLWHMFGAYFHQDWNMEGDDWRELVQNYIGSEQQSDLEAVAAELDRLLSDFQDDDALGHELFDVLGCSYMPYPHLSGPTLRLWLGEFTVFLRAGATLS